MRAIDSVYRILAVAASSLLACGADSASSQSERGAADGGDAAADSALDSALDTTPEGAPDSPPDGTLDSASDGSPDVGVDGNEPLESGADSGEATAPPAAVELLDDNRFLDGFNTYPVAPSTTPTGTLVPPTASGSPVWRLAEWHTAQLLTNGPPTMTQWGAEWTNAYKRVVISDGFLELAINAEAEYGGSYRQSGEDWPHLLVAQQFYDESAPQSNTPIHRYESVTLSLELDLVYANHIMETGYDPSLHACQFLMFITLQNRNVNHQDYGNFIWFGLPFYDDRYATLAENIAIDTGTGKYMFRMASQNFMPDSLHSVPSLAISVDLLPYMKASVEDAIAQGILASSNLDDYYLGGMNMGFEVPGRSVATMRVRALSIIGERVSTP